MFIILIVRLFPQVYTHQSLSNLKVCILLSVNYTSTKLFLQILLRVLTSCDSPVAAGRMGLE